mgnify:CR=1 FL=1
MPKHAFIFCFAVGLSLTDKAFCLPIYSIAIVQIVFPEMVFENAIRSNHCIGVRREITNVCIPVFCQAVDWNISRSRTIYSWCRVKEKAKYLFQLLIVCFKRQNLILKNIIYCHDFSPINDNLEAQAQAYFDSLFITNKNPDCTLADISVVNPARSLQKGTVARCFEMATLPTSGCIPIGGEEKPYNGGVRFKNGDTIIARITPCLENGKAAYINILNEGEVAFGSTEYIVFAAKEGYPSSFYYFLIRNSQFVQFALQFMNGSSGRQRVSGEELASFPLKRPSHDQLLAFDRVGNAVLEQMKHYAQEIQSLKQLQVIQAAALSH